MQEGREFIPHISLEDKVEQLLIEYQETPNPNLMLYFYQETEDGWMCPCSRENLAEERFCGNCGTSREWLIAHTNDLYLASKIISRKGEQAVFWQDLGDTLQAEQGDGKTTAKVDSPESEAQHGPAYRKPNIGRVDRKDWVRTRLNNYSNKPVRRFFQYMLVFGTPKRRMVFFALVAVVIMTFAGILLAIYGNRNDVPEETDTSELKSMRFGQGETEISPLFGIEI